MPVFHPDLKICGVAEDERPIIVIGLKCLVVANSYFCALRIIDNYFVVLLHHYTLP